MNREFANFMGSQEINAKNASNEINSKDISIYNIRVNDNGLYFNIKINVNDEQKAVNNLFISSKFYKKNNTIETKTQTIHEFKNRLIAYFLIYPAAIFSLAIIFAAFFKYLPVMEKFLNFSSLY